MEREPTCFEIYTRLHQPKGKPNQWLTKRQETIAETYLKRVAESQSGGEGGGEGSSSTNQSENRIYLDVVGGKNKKGRVYGLGTKAATVLSSVSTQSSMHIDGVSLGEVVQMKSKIEDLSAELEQKNIEQEMMKKKMEKWEKMFKKMMVLNNLTGLEEDDIGEDMMDGDDEDEA